MDETETRKNRLRVRVGDIRPLTDVVAQIGLDLPDLLAGLELPRNLFQQDDDTRLALADYFRILERLTEQAQDETGHLSARPILPGSTNFVMSHLAGCKTLYDAVKIIAETYNILHGGSYNQVEKRDGYLIYRINDREFPYTFNFQNYIHFTMECVLIIVHTIICLVSGQSLTGQLKKTYSKRPRGSASTPLACWDIPTRYNASSYTLFYDIAVAELPLSPTGLMPNTKSIFQAAIAAVDQTPDGRSRFKNLSTEVIALLDQSVLDQKEVASRLNVSIATLRRRLRDEGESFRSLRADAQNRLARQLLAQSRSISDIAERLGFSDMRSFSRAFKSHHGLTPKRYRSNLSKP